MRDYLIDEICTLPEDYWWFYGKWRLARSLLDKHRDRPIRRFLDVGCGGGQWAAQFGRISGARTFGTDNAPPAAKLAREKGVLAAAADTNLSPFQTGSFDLVTSFDVMEHIKDDLAFLCEIRRVLGHGGLTLIHVPAHQVLFSYWDRIHGHFRRYTTRSMRELCRRAGLTPVEMQYAHILPFLPAVVVRTAQNLRYGDDHPREGYSEHKVLPPALNWLVHRIYDGEALMRKRVNLPIGLSLIVIARKD